MIKPLKALALAGLMAVLPSCSRVSPAGPTAPVVVWGTNAPYSTDPFEYDAFIHQLAFTSVHGWLVTHYAAGDYRGELAESWKSSPDFKEWLFVIRPGMTFENGEPITAESVAESWTRLARVLKMKGSDPGLLGQLEGFAEFSRQSPTLRGMTAAGNVLTLRFSKPMPGLLADMASGFYAVVHPSSFDPATGRWLDPRKTVASGPYRIAEWTDRRLRLKLRADYPKRLTHPRPMETVDIVWDPAERGGADLLAGFSSEDFGQKGYAYHGGPASSISFIKCQSWRDSASPLSDIAFRRALRDRFYEDLRKNGIKPVLSFFPLAIKGTREMAPVTRQPVAAVRKGTLKYRPFNPVVSFLVAPARAAVQSAAARFGLGFEVVESPLQDVRREWRTVHAGFRHDLVSSGTGILIEDPDADIRFMFNSQEGILLPDPTGRAAQVIAHSRIDVQAVNEILWDDAIIWPVLHASEGLWARPQFDLSMVNVVLPPTALHFIGWK